METQGPTAFLLKATSQYVAGKDYVRAMPASGVQGLGLTAYWRQDLLRSSEAPRSRVESQDRFRDSAGWFLVGNEGMRYPI